MKKDSRIYLSPPHMTGEEMKLVQEAFESNYIAPTGPQVERFEREFAEVIGASHALAVSSGTAAMHLALRVLDIGPGDEVFASDLTFIGSVSPIVFQGATPVFIDCDRDTWNMDPELLEEELKVCEKSGKLPKVVVPTDLYGQCADYDRILNICSKYGVPVVADSAESLGAKYKLAADPSSRKELQASQRLYPDRSPRQATHRRSQTFSSAGMAEEKESSLSQKNKQAEFRYSGFGADAAIFSFNGNKILTTSCGGMLVSEDEDLIRQAKLFAQQAREPFPHYEHCHIGYNYRMSNILAAIGIGQLKALDERVVIKREIFSYYHEALTDVPGIEFMPEAIYGKSNRWLTVLLINPVEFGADREAVRLALEEENIESRPIWKPMHMQPVFECGLGAGKGPQLNMQCIPRGKHRARCIEHRVKARVVGGEVAEDLFNRGLCLPSGTQMTGEDLDRVAYIIKKVYNKG